MKNRIIIISGITLLFIISLVVQFCTSPTEVTKVHSNTFPSKIQEDTTAMYNFQQSVPQAMKKIDSGYYIPTFTADSSLVKVQEFYMDIFPVQQKQFEIFVKYFYNWRRSHIKKIFADGNYLQNWMNDTSSLDSAMLHYPVTNISWFAAKAYCKCLGKRLPTTEEWEYAGNADNRHADARQLASFNQFILMQYERQNSYNNPVGSSYENYWGVYDMHALVWEWTADFNSVMITGESRKDGSIDNKLFCGGGSLGAKDLMNYAAFMRYAFRGSLKANYCIQNLGFRCVKDKIN